MIILQAGKVNLRTATMTTPWSRSVAAARGTEVYLTAYNPSQTGELKCSITLDKIP